MYRRNGQTVYLIDTPGFDDTHLEYAAVFRKIASFICTYCDGYGHSILIGGMIYVQRITDMRMSGSSLKSLRIFEKICGERHFQDVVVVTTMWNSLKTKEAQDAAMMREKMMGERPEFFGNMMGNGARMERYQGDTYSGIRIVELLADRRGTITLQLQREMERGVATKLEDTTAGRYIDGELANAREKYETQKRELEECAEDTGDDDDLKSEYVEQAEDCTRMVKNITADQKSLSVTLEDMRNEQVAWCSKGQDDHTEDAMHENTSTRIFELEHKVQDLERVIQEQRVEGLNAQREGIEKIEATKQDIDQAKERDQIARDKAKQKRAAPSEAIVWMRDFFAGRRTTENLPPPRRADSMPTETKLTKKTDTQVWKIGSRPKGRHSGRPNIKRTSSDDHPRQPYADSQYLQHQQTCEPEYLSDAESGLESETEGSAPPMYTPHHPHSYTPVAAYAHNSRYHISPYDVSSDPTGMVRVPPPQPQPLMRRIPHSAGPPYGQHLLRAPSHNSGPPGDSHYRGQ
ncbi:hypothetical protein J4E89_000029 [Alternaria sp. Ai002NY15]|nr:hypothetical protein J4E89_000029 [Alternaria sp. Ai002NY15]